MNMDGMNTTTPPDSIHDLPKNQNTLHKNAESALVQIVHVNSSVRTNLLAAGKGYIGLVDQTGIHYNSKR